MICGTLPPDGERRHAPRPFTGRALLLGERFVDRVQPAGCSLRYRHALASKVGLARGRLRWVSSPLLAMDACGLSVERGIANTASPMPNRKIAAIPSRQRDVPVRLRDGRRAAGAACVAVGEPLSGAPGAAVCVEPATFVGAGRSFAGAGASPNTDAFADVSANTKTFFAAPPAKSLPVTRGGIVQRGRLVFLQTSRQTS